MATDNRLGYLESLGKKGPVLSDAYVTENVISGV